MRGKAKAARKKKATRKKTSGRTTSKAKSTSKAKATPTPAAPTPEPGLPPSLLEAPWALVGAGFAARGADPLTDDEVRALAGATAPVLDHYLGDDEAGPAVALAITALVVFGPRVMQVRAKLQAEREREQDQPGRAAFRVIDGGKPA